MEVMIRSGRRQQRRRQLVHSGALGTRLSPAQTLLKYLCRICAASDGSNVWGGTSDYPR